MPGTTRPTARVAGTATTSAAVARSRASRSLLYGVVTADLAQRVQGVVRHDDGEHRHQG